MAKNRADETDAKTAKSDKKVDKKKKKPNKAGLWIKGFFSELKKVTWPSFVNVLKQTGVVLLVTVCFLLVLMAFDSLFGWLHGLLIDGITSESITALGSYLHGGGALWL